MGEWYANVDISLWVPSPPPPPPPLPPPPLPIQPPTAQDSGVWFGIHPAGSHINQVAPALASLVLPFHLPICISAYYGAEARHPLTTLHPSVFNFLPEQIMICLLKLRGAFVTQRADIFVRCGWGVDGALINTMLRGFRRGSFHYRWGDETAFALLSCCNWHCWSFFLHLVMFLGLI